MRPVYMIAGGITKFRKAESRKSFRVMVKEAYDYARRDVPKLTIDTIDGTVVSYFSDHFTRQLKAGVMAVDMCGLVPKPTVRIEGGGATGGLCVQEGLAHRCQRHDGLRGGHGLRDHVPRQYLEGDNLTGVFCTT